MFSSLVSHIVNARYRYPRLVAQLASSTASTTKAETWAGAVAAASASTAQQATKRNIPEILPSLGASGAIYAAVMMTAIISRLSSRTVYSPNLSNQYSIRSRRLDAIRYYRYHSRLEVRSSHHFLPNRRLTLFSRLFDHWAHLGGAAFGIFYYYYGPSHWLALRKDVIEAESPS